jgi:hypothetical protein
LTQHRQQIQLALLSIAQSLTSHKQKGFHHQLQQQAGQSPLRQEMICISISTTSIIHKEMLLDGNMKSNHAKTMGVQSANNQIAQSQTQATANTA